MRVTKTGTDTGPAPFQLTDTRQSTITSAPLSLHRTFQTTCLSLLGWDTRRLPLSCVTPLSSPLDLPPVELQYLIPPLQLRTDSPE